MPELPEVENIKNDLNKSHLLNKKVIAIETSQKKLRSETNENLTKLVGQKLLGIHRRAKFLIFEFDDFFLLNHLGMTGHWRIDKKKHTINHDHVKIKFNNNLILVYNDIRRFGFVELIKKNSKTTLENMYVKNKWLKNLGPEPFFISPIELYNQAKNMNCAIKGLLLNQKIIVGIGNIYASEILFKSKILPTRICHKLTLTEFKKILKNTHLILSKSIASGGSTIQNYKRLNNKAGGFQNFHLVYNRQSKPCKSCKKPIKKITQLGRSTFYCPNCQK